jgi:ribose/xylose/arabinose/galactoside ABC-type transport system permease subunit
MRTPWWQRLAPLLGLFLLCLVLSLASPHFLTVDNLLNVLRQSAINAILALGQLVVIITAGIDLSIGSVVGLTIVILTLLMRHGVPALAAALLALVVGTLIQHWLRVIRITGFAWASSALLRDWRARRGAAMWCSLVR